MTIDFYLDFACTFVLNCYETLSWCGQNKKETDQATRNIWKKRILFGRVTLGLIFNITSFMVVCVVNKEVFIVGAAACVFFTFIVVFIAIYIAVEVVVLIQHEDGINSKDEFLKWMAFYRTYEIEFDILVLIYNLIISDWKMSTFTLLATLLACGDILLNICFLLKSIFHNAENKEYVYKLVVFGLFSPPFAPIVIVIVWFLVKSTLVTQQQIDRVNPFKTLIKMKEND